MPSQSVPPFHIRLSRRECEVEVRIRFPEVAYNLLLPRFFFSNLLWLLLFGYAVFGFVGGGRVWREREGDRGCAFRYMFEWVCVYIFLSCRLLHCSLCCCFRLNCTTWVIRLIRNSLACHFISAHVCLAQRHSIHACGGKERRSVIRFQVSSGFIIGHTVELLP